MNLVGLASQYYRTTISIFLFVIISGSLVFNNIPKESSPDVSLPYIYVSLGLTGISPEDSEKLLIKPIEDEISNIEGKNQMTSTAYQGGGNILLEFNEGFDPDQALLDTREQVDRAKSDLPDDAEEPKVSEVNISLFPILVVSISGDISEFLLKKVSNDLKDKKNSFISRAYYKLEEIDRKKQLITKDCRVLDIGCAPGGWSQYVLNKHGNQRVVGIDILPMEHTFGENFEFYNYDLNEFAKIFDTFKSKKYLFDIIISDIAPNTSGNQFTDQANSFNLSLLSVKFIDDFLKKGGHFLVKNFQGEDTEHLYKEIKKFFNKSSYIKPSASDKNSKEIYILGLEKK